jgi:hypothetical protein
MREESPELVKMHEFLRATVYFLVLLEMAVFININTGDTLNAVMVKMGRIYTNIFYSKLFILAVLIFTCIGTRARKDIELKPLKDIALPVFFGFLFFFGSALFVPDRTFKTLQTLTFSDYLFVAFCVGGTILLNVGFDNISKFVQHNLMKDRFNIENESFEQTTKLIETEYSVNLPMSFYYRKKRHKGWINIVNPFRGTLVMGTPGSGKSFTVINSFIRQLAAKGFSLCVYDFKFPDLGRLAYYQFVKNRQKGILPDSAVFNVVNFVDIGKSVRFNPIKPEYVNTLAAAGETAEALIEALKKGANTSDSGGNEQFFTLSAVNFVTAVIYFLSKYENGKYCDLPHVISFMNGSYEDMFKVLYTNVELTSLLSMFYTAYRNRAYEQLEGQVGSAKVGISRLATKESFWVLTEDSKRPPVNLKISDQDNPSYLIIANSPETQNINSALNALMLNRLVRLINSRGNRPCAILVDELPTLYFYKLENLLSTARSNRVAVVLGLQELPQLKSSFGRMGAEQIISVIGNVIAGSVRSKETLDWLEKLFGKIKQLKTNLSIDRDRQTVSLNENLDFLIPASKIADLPTSEFVAQIALDYGINHDDFKSTKYNCKVELDTEAIKREENAYFDTPVYYQFASNEERDFILMQNFQRINKEVADFTERIIFATPDRDDD